MKHGMNRECNQTSKSFNNAEKLNPPPEYQNPESINQNMKFNGINTRVGKKFEY